MLSLKITIFFLLESFSGPLHNLSNDNRFIVDGILHIIKCRCKASNSLELETRKIEFVSLFAIAIQMLRIEHGPNNVVEKIDIYT